MELSQIIPHIEALIFASDKPLTNLDLVELLNNAIGFIDDRATLDQVESAVDGIHEKYSAEFYAFELKQSGGGWQFLTKKEYHKTIAQLNGDKFLKRLSNAALETLAIIAYKQPITKSEIEAIRGVNCDYAVQKLLEKDLVIIAGRNEEAVGKPLIYTTSKSFMDYFGINSTNDLPKINEVLMEELVQATVVNNNNGQAENEVEEGEGSADKIFAVTETGELIENTASAANEDAEMTGDENMTDAVTTDEESAAMEINEDVIDQAGDAEATIAAVAAQEEIAQDQWETNDETAEDKQVKKEDSTES